MPKRKIYDKRCLYCGETFLNTKDHMNRHPEYKLSKLKSYTWEARRLCRLCDYVYPWREIMPEAGKIPEISDNEKQQAKAHLREFHDIHI